MIIEKEVLPVLLGRISKNPCRISGNHSIVGNIFGNDRPCPRDHIITDRDARQHDTVSAEPDVIAYRDWFPVKVVFDTLYGVHRVDGSIEAALRTYQTVVADGNAGSVQEDNIKIGKKAFPYMNIVAEVAVKRRFNKDSIITGTEKFL